MKQANNSTLALEVQQVIREVPDFPRPGVMFKDITPLLAQPDLRQRVVAALCAPFVSDRPDAVAAIEARGFIFGVLMAQYLQVPFLPVRKEGKLPYQTVKQSYALEYGTAAIEIHTDALRPGARVLIHDDVLATGGTAGAAARVIRELAGEVLGFSFLLNLSFLGGQKRLEVDFGLPVHVLLDA